MKPYTKHNIRIWQSFSNKGKTIFEIENGWITTGKINGILLESILLGVYQKNKEGLFTRIRAVEIGLIDFLKISNSPKYILF